MTGEVTHFVITDYAEIVPAHSEAALPSTGSNTGESLRDDSEVAIEYQYEILNYRPPQTGMRAAEGWQTVPRSEGEHAGRFVFQLPDGVMQVRVRSVRKGSPERPEEASPPSAARAFTVEGTAFCPRELVFCAGVRDGRAVVLAMKRIFLLFGHNY